MVRGSGAARAAGSRRANVFNLGDGVAAAAPVAPPVSPIAPSCIAVPCADVMDGVTSIGSSGSRFASVAVRNGELYGWGGEESWGTTGVSTPTASTYTRIPRRIGTLTGVSAVAVGDFHALAIGPGNAVYVWGYDGHALGLAGQSTSVISAVPNLVTLP